MTTAEIRTELTKVWEKYNDACLADKQADAMVAYDKIKGLIDQYATAAQNECFAELKQHDDIMLEACKQLTYPVLRLKETVDETGTVTVSIEDVDRYIDILKLHKSTVNGIGANKAWAAHIEKLGMLLTADVAKNINGKNAEVLKTYKISKAGNAVEMALSKTQLTKCINDVMHCMIGDSYNAISYDAGFLREAFSRKGRAFGTITCANAKSMRQYIMEICHRAITNKEYTVEYKKEGR